MTAHLPTVLSRFRVCGCEFIVELPHVAHALHHIAYDARSANQLEHQPERVYRQQNEFHPADVSWSYDAPRGIPSPLHDADRRPSRPVKCEPWFVFARVLGHAGGYRLDTVTSADDAYDDAFIWHLHHGEKRSVRDIARRLGVNRGKVFRALTRHAAALANGDGGVALMDSDGTDGLPVPPFWFVGIVEPPERGQGQEERFLDANGVPCSSLDIERWRLHQTYVVGDGETADRVDADTDAQIAAAGYVKAPDPNRPGCWRWVRPT